MGLDLTMMFAVHDAMRRDLDRLARATERPDDDPAAVLRTALGWELFKRHLHVHHTAEDAALWGVLERNPALTGSDRALLAAMEAEHAVIDPLLELVDATLADRDHGPHRLGGAGDALASALRGHLRHEERDGLPLVEARVAESEWQAFGEEHRARIGPGGPQYLPWLLDGATPEKAAEVLTLMPPPLVAAYEADWRPAYEASPRWPAA